MSITKSISDFKENYEKLMARLELYEKLGQAEMEAKSNKNTISHQDLMDELLCNRKQKNPNKKNYSCCKKV